MSDLIDKFHKHLDKCQQCRENPFNLCAVGALMLNAAVASLACGPAPRTPDAAPLATELMDAGIEILSVKPVYSRRRR